MKITYSSLYQIDHASNNVNKIDVSPNSPDLFDYVTDLLNDITTNKNKRRYQFTSETTEVRASIDKYLHNDCENASYINAQRLLRIEKQAEQTISQLPSEIQKGSLFQAFIENPEAKRIVISKADHSYYLDDADFKLRAGLPRKKRIFKAFIAEINSDNSVTDVYVYDTNPTMSKYWWRDFLELSEVYTDSHNTKTALDILDRKIFNPLKNQYPADHTLLRNSTIKYFRSAPAFELDKYIESVFESYDPIDPAFDGKMYIQRIKELPEKWHFDPRFTIIKEDIDKRLVKNTIQLTDTIDLVLNDYVENLKAVIQADTEKDGRRFVKIYSDSGYERFRRSES